MMFHQHIPHTLLQRLLDLPRAFLDQLPVRVQTERKLREHTQLAFDLHPPGTADEGPAMIPASHRIDRRAEQLEPQVQDLLGQSDADETAQLHVHLRMVRVMRQVDGLDGAEQQFLRGQDLPVLVQTEGTTQH